MAGNSSLSDMIWDTKYWFPKEMAGEKYNWNDLKNTPGSSTYYPEMNDLHWGIVLGVFLVILRYVLETVAIIPFGYKLGIKKRRVIRLEHNPVLENTYKTCKKIDDSTYQVLSKQLDIPVRQIEIWFRKRKAKDSSSPIKKFCDNSWQLIFYTVAFLYGCKVLWNKPWVYRTRECWEKWPKQHVTSDLYWYYVVELAFYWSLVFTLITDHKRKDFKEMLCHHFATIILIYFSWLVNFVRIGSLVLILHDASDPWLATAKMGIYLKKKTFTDVTFAIFVLIWTLSRLIYFPFWVLNSSLREVYYYITEPFFVYYFFNSFLLLLVVLHIMWTISIYRIIYNTAIKGQVEDTRSDTEEEDEYETEKEENGQCNGVEHHEPSMTNGSTKKRVNGNANIIAENGTANGKKSAKRETTL